MFNGRNLHQRRFFKIYPLELRLFQLLSALAMSLFEKSTRTFQRMHVTKKFKSVSPVSPWSTPPVNGYSQPTPPSAPTYHRRKPGFNDNQPYFFSEGGWSYIDLTIAIAIFVGFCVSHRIHGKKRYIYLHENPQIYGKCIGKYSITSHAANMGFLIHAPPEAKAQNFSPPAPLCTLHRSINHSLNTSTKANQAT